MKRFLLLSVLYAFISVAQGYAQQEEETSEYPTIVSSYRGYYSRLSEYGIGESFYEAMTKTKGLLKHWDMYYHTGHGVSKIWTYYAEMSDTLIENNLYTPVTISEDTLYYRQEGDKVYWRRNDGEEYIILDYNLNEGEFFYSPISGAFVVTKVEYAEEVDGSENSGYKQWRYKDYASFFGTRPPKIMHLSKEDGQEDIWIEGYGSINWGIMPMEHIYYVNAFPYDPTASHVIMASDMCSRISFEINEDDYKRIFFNPDDMDYEDYYQNADEKGLGVNDYIRNQNPWTFTFEGDTLCITGIMELNCIPTFAECFIKGDVIDVNIAQIEDWWIQPDCLSERRVNVRIPGFKPGAYEIGMEGEEHCSVTCGLVEYTPFVAENKAWKYAWSKNALFNDVDSIDYFYFDNDTIVNPLDGNTCKKWMHKSLTLSSRQIEYIGAVCERDKQVYLYQPHQTEAVRLYDFAAHVGDTVLLYNTSMQKNEVGYISDKYTLSPVGNKGTLHDFHLVEASFPSHVTTWIEGIGSATLRPDKNKDEPGWGMTLLLTCIANNDTLYDLPDYVVEKISPYWDEDEIGGNVKKETLDFTHVIKTKPTSPAMTATSPLLRAEYNGSVLFIHTEGMAGQYQIKIHKDDEAQYYFATTSDLSNMQSIDVNLNDYSEGKYTITVENDNELFMGHFVLPFDGTGVESICKTSFAMHNDGIYDLSGRKMVNGKLKKGFYIQDGKKFVRK